MQNQMAKIERVRVEQEHLFVEFGNEQRRLEEAIMEAEAVIELEERRAREAEEEAERKREEERVRAKGAVEIKEICERFAAGQLKGVEEERKKHFGDLMK